MTAVPPNVTNPEAQALLNRAQDVQGPPNVRVARAAKRRKIAKMLLDTAMITEAEYGDHECFQSHCTASAIGVIVGGDAPDGFGPAIALALAPVIERLEKIEARLDNIESRLDTIEAT